MAPLIVKDDAAATLVLPTKVTAPLLNAVPVATNAPTPPTPVPARRSASVPMLILPISSVAPSTTVVPAAALPSAVLLDATKVPVFTVVVPL